MANLKMGKGMEKECNITPMALNYMENGGTVKKLIISLLVWSKDGSIDLIRKINFLDLLQLKFIVVVYGNFSIFSLELYYRFLRKHW